VVWSLEYREHIDVLRYKDWSRIAYLYGLADTYKTHHLTFGGIPNNQPPGSLYFLSAAYTVDFQVTKIFLKLTHTPPGDNIWVNVSLVTLFLRLPSVFADIGIGILIYLFIKKRKSEKAALLGSSLFLFSPPVWYNSAFWGQMDSLNNLFFFAGVFLLYEKKYFFAILSVCLSLFIKLSVLPGIIVFCFLLVLHKQKNRWQLIVWSVISLLFIGILSLPVAKGNLFWLVDFVQKNSLGEMQYITNFAFNFWWFFFQSFLTIESTKNLYAYSIITIHHTPTADTQFIGVSLRIWATGLFLILLAPFLAFLFKIRKHMTPEKGILALSISLLIGFMILPTMHERYLYPVLPFLATYVGLQKKYLTVFILLSLFNALNLYIVWHPMKLFFLPYELINNGIFQWLISLGIVVTSVYFYQSAWKLFGARDKKIPA